MSSRRSATGSAASRPSSCTRCCRPTEITDTPGGRRPPGTHLLHHRAVSQLSTAAELVLVGGPVITMNPGPSAHAVAVAGGRIVAVGDDREVSDFVGPRTRRIDLRGRTLLPGFIDAHCH